MTKNAERLELLLNDLFGNDLTRENIKYFDSFGALHADENLLGYGEQAVAEIREVAKNADDLNELIEIAAEKNIMLPNERPAGKARVLADKRYNQRSALLEAARELKTNPA